MKRRRPPDVRAASSRRVRPVPSRDAVSHEFAPRRGEKVVLDESVDRKLRARVSKTHMDVTGGWVGMNRLGVMREWSIGQERERKTLQHIIT
jgi:hypothetical protein